MNEPLLAYHFKHFYKNYSQSWKYEVKRLGKIKQSPFTLQNRVVQIVLIHTTYLFLIYYFLGLLTLQMQIAYSIFIQFAAETTNYI